MSNKPSLYKDTSSIDNTEEDIDLYEEDNCGQRDCKHCSDYNEDWDN